MRGRASAALWFKLTHFNFGTSEMKLTHIVIASTLSAFGEGQSSMSGTGGASRHAPPPKHKKHKTRRAANNGTHSHP
jgi:hypothetical protein